MNILKDISGAEDRDIIISLTKEKSWLEYLSYFLELRYQNLNLEIVVPDIPRTSVGKKCFLVYDGFLRGFMSIYKIRENAENEIVIDLIPIIVPFNHKLPVADIEGYKYYFDNSNTQ